MTWQLRLGLPLLAASLIGTGLNLWAREAFPNQWGGPNIGGGGLQLLFDICAIAGAVLTVMGLLKLRNKRNS